MSLSTGSHDSHTQESRQRLVCSKCEVRYPNIHELLVHQESAQHFACNKCTASFRSEADIQVHKRQKHRPELDLECFGCHLHFNSANGFWRHLEDNKCKVIFPSDIARLRERNIKFAEQLELRKVTLHDIMQSDSESHIKREDTWASVAEIETASTEPAVNVNYPSRPAPISRANANPLHYRSDDFPALPKKSAVTAKTGPLTERKGNVWSNRGVDVSMASSTVRQNYNAVAPPQFYDASAIKPHTVAPGGRIVDPNHPDYNAAVFYNELVEKFVCPYKICYKKFNGAGALTVHLRSPAHAEVSIRCIRCCKEYKTVANLIAHMETAKTKCPIRETDGFPRVLGQLTGGILGYHRRSGMFLIDKASVEMLFSLRSQQ
ncbi:hypothetical protein F4808DRAFT_410630 [Astrocystis sublimbata]|nr:hypothetical protein F4808DRAFT_410630 [Astrocystis sublimbata]